MKTNGLMKKSVVAGIILLFVCAAIAPSIDATAVTIDKPGGIPTDQKTVQVSCHYVTYTRDVTIEREITADQYEYLVELFHQSDDRILVTSLQRLELLPKTITEQNAEDLLSGNYGRRESLNNQQSSTPYPEATNVTNGTNILCKIQGDAVDSYYRPLWWLISSNIIGWTGYCIGVSFFLLDQLLRHLFRWYPLLTWDYDWGILIALMFFFASFGDFIPDDGEGSFIGAKIPPKLNGFVSVNLDDAFHVAKPNLLTSGASGEWEIHDNRWVSIQMLGFTGVWITIPDMEQSDGCMFKGFCLYVKANARDF